MPMPDTEVLTAERAVPALASRWNAWPPRRIILLATLGAALIATWFFAPRFWYWRVLGVDYRDLVAVQPEFNRALAALAQLENPWQPITDPTHRVIEWRLLFPVAGHYLGLPAGLYLSLPHIGAVLALFAAATQTWRRTRDALTTTTTTLLVATTSWFFVATGWLAYFDSWLVLALILASFAERRWVGFAVALAAPWIDERFILSLPLCCAVRWIVSGNAGRRHEWFLDAAALVAGVLPYAATRAGLELRHVRATSQSYWADRPLLPASIPVMLWAAWNGLRLGWVPVAMFRGATGGSRLAVMAVVAVTLVLNLCIADDLSRSVSIAVPLLIAGAVAWWRRNPAGAQRGLALLAMGNLLLPAEHVIASPTNPQEAYHRLPILNFSAEWGRSRELPYEASPLTYNRRGMEAFTAGNYAAAIRAYSIALRFAPEYPLARANLGVARFMNGQPREGLADMDAALARAPWLYESRMQRATIRLQLGDLPGAFDDVDRALRDMPADWVKRAEAEQFRTTLAQKLGRR